MKRIALSFCAASILLLSCNNNSDDKSKATSSATDTTTKMADKKNEPAAAAAPVDSATMMKNWMAFMTPGDVHKMIASWNGTWKTDITMYEPGKPPTKTTGTAVNKMVLGGRYQESVNTAMMMGMPFEGHGTIGYNNATKMFESSWIDNMGTGIMKMTGAWDAATKSITLSGMGVDPYSMKEKESKEIFTVVDDKTQTMSMYGSGPDGKEFKFMDMTFTRK